MSACSTTVGGDGTCGPSDVQRLGFITPDWPPELAANGIVSHVANMRRVLQAGGVDVHLVMPRKRMSEAGDWRQVWESRTGAAPTLAGRVVGAIRRRFPAWQDTVAVRNIGAGVAEVVERLRRTNGLQLVESEESFGWAREVARRSGVPVVVRLHGPWFLNGSFDEGRRDSASLRRIRREGEAIAAAAGVSAPSQDVLDRVREFYDLPLTEARVITMPMVAPPESERWRLDACDRDRILFVGRFDNHKGGDVLIDAFLRVLDRRPSARLTFAGLDRGVEVEPGRGKQSLREFVQERMPGALDDGRIEFAGRLTPSELDDRRRGALITAVASRYETFGNTLREAMILGCPVVSTNAGGLAEPLEDGVNALVVPPEDSEAMAAAFLRLLDSPEEAATLGARALQDCSRLYHPDRIFAESLQFYGEVVARYAAERR